MLPTFFLTICLGGIICLTPVAVYLFWLNSINRKPHPSVVSSTWSFVATVCALIGFLFCIGILLGMAVLDANLLVGGPFSQLARRLPWLQHLWLIIVAGYLLLVSRAIRKGLARRQGCLDIFQVEGNALTSTVDAILAGSGRQTTVQGTTWLEEGKSIVEMQWFPAFAHATIQVNLHGPAAVAFENELRSMVPRLPAAHENPASVWIGAVSTCVTVAVGCCVALIFALPFLR